MKIKFLSLVMLMTIVPAHCKSKSEEPIDFIDEIPEIAEPQTKQSKPTIIKDLLRGFKKAKVENSNLQTCIKTGVLSSNDLDTQDDTGNTFLHYAAEQGNSALVKQLINSGASPEIRNEDGENAQEVIERKMLATTAYTNDKKTFKQYNSCLSTYKKAARKNEKKTSVVTAIDAIDVLQ